MDRWTDGGDFASWPAILAKTWPKSSPAPGGDGGGKHQKAKDFIPEVEGLESLQEMPVE